MASSADGGVRLPRESVVRLLRSVPFRLLLLVRLTGQFGDGLLQAGLASFVLLSPERQASPGRVAAALTLLLLPYSLVGPFAGAFIDHWRRRQVLLVADLTRAVLAVALAALVARSSVGVAFGVLALSVIGVNRFVLAALPAAQPHVVDPPDLVTSNALAPTLGSGATLVGVLAGIGLRSALGGSDPAAGWIVVAGAIAYTLAAALCLPIATASLGPDPDAPRPDVSPVGTAYALLDAARHVVAQRSVVLALTALTLVRAVFGAWTVLAIVRERTVLHPPTDTTGALAELGAATAIGGVGAALGAILTPGAARRFGVRRWVIALVLACLLGCATIVPVVSSPAILGMALVLGFVYQGVKICSDTVLQRRIGDAWRGRAFSITDLLANVSFVLAAIVTVPFA
ncbi:MAG TPA: MFS transporter [Actinomycetes bacterium]|nr:MFS transporter [Actinomycetes bacterium]